MPRILKVGIVGFGVVGKRRQKCIDENINLETVAVCDQTFSDDGTFSNGIRYYRSYKSLLSEDLDIIFVCISPDLAVEVTLAGMTRGYHIFCEKPPGCTVAEIIEVVSMHRINPHLKLKYGFNHRYHDSVTQALEITRNNELGQIINLRGVYGKSKYSNWRTQRDIAGGGILLDQGIHMVDLIRLFIGEVEEVKSFVSNLFWKYDVEDNAYALLKSKHGVIAMLHSSATQWRHQFHLELAFERGAVLLSGILSGSKSYGAETITVVRRNDDDDGDPLEQMTRFNEDLSWQREVDDFAEAVVNDRAISNGSAIDALRTMHLVFRIYCADDAWRRQWNLEADLPEDLFAN